MKEVTFLKQLSINPSPLTMIPSIYKSLTKAEQKVAERVLGETHEAVYYSVTDLAEKSNVGETTVIRFCRKLGYSGYQDFKLALAQNLVSPSENVHGKIEENDSIEVLSQKITGFIEKAVKDTLELLQDSQLLKASEAILRANKIYFFGVGSSGITARDAEYRFMRLGFNVGFACDAHIIAMNAALVSKNDVIIGISASGSTKDLVDAIRIAKHNGAYIVCLTNHAKSPITQYADAILLTATKETPFQGGAFSSKIVQLHALEILSTYVALRRKEETFQSIEKTAKAVIDKLY